MSGKIAIELGHVQETLFLPLWGRAVETQKKEPLLVDKAAVEIINRIDYDFYAIERNISEISQLGWIVRSLLIDGTVRCFLDKHPKATIVNIGCGLDTTFDRIDNGILNWYDLDLPDVIELRRKFIKENNRRKFIAESFLDEKWTEQLKKEDNVLFIAAGVFYYFEENQIKSFLNRLSDLYPKSEIILDATSPIGLKFANKTVIKSCGLDERSFLKWGLKRAERLKLFNKRIEIIDELLLFGNVQNKLKTKIKIIAFISNLFKMQYMIHLRL